MEGGYVNTITKNGPADKAGIHRSTIDQYSIDGHNITKSDDLINYIGQHKIAADNIICFGGRSFTVFFGSFCNRIALCAQ